MIKWIIIFLIFLAIIFSLFFSFKNEGNSNNRQSLIVDDKQISLPYNARFEIYTLGTKRIFTDSKYHQLNPDVYITSKDPSLIFVNKDDVTWNDFFKTLPMTITNDCLTTGTGQKFCNNNDQVLNFYLNDIKQEVLNKVIQKDDFLIIKYEKFK